MSSEARRGYTEGRVQVVDYREIQFSKAPSVLSGMGLDHLTKTAGALDELRHKGLAGRP